MTAHKSKSIGRIINTKYGPVKVLSVEDHACKPYKYKVMFLNTGYQTITTLDQLQRDRIKDYYAPTICGVGALGDAVATNNLNEYNIWINMIKKCYDTNNSSYYLFGANGYKVCDRWLRFDYFLEDYKKYNMCGEPNCTFLILPEYSNFKLFSFEYCNIVSKNLNISFNDKVYHSNGYGDFICIGYENRSGRNFIKIRFLQTGYETTATAKRILEGSVKDRYYPKIYGVGFIGHGNVTNNIRARGIWSKMLSRCYNPYDKSYMSYGALGVRVDERWFNFGNFLDDIKELNGYNEWLKNDISYELDKDKLQVGIPKHMMVYSKYTCIFIPVTENMDMMLENIHNNSSRLYYGVTPTPAGNYQSRIKVIYEKQIGTFSSEDAAANAYNYWAEILHSSRRNDAPYMPPEEWMKYRTNTREMCRIVDKSELVEMCTIIDKGVK